MVAAQFRMEEVTKTTPSKTNHRKTASSISSSGDETTDPAPINEKVWLYEENIKKLYNLDDNPDRQKFLDEFFHYRRTNGLYCKIPVIARKPLDVFQLFNIVQRYGGFEQTMKNRMWSQIARELELPRTMTSGAFTLKLKYIRLLYQFECFKSKKQVNKSILFNEAILNETAKERYDVDDTRRHRYVTMVHSPIEDDSVVEYIRHNKEKEYREALMTQIAKSEDAMYPQHERSRMVYRQRRSPADERYIPSPDKLKLSPTSPASVDDNSHFALNPLKRRNESSEPANKFDGHRNKKQKLSSLSEQLSRFTVDLLETTPTHITLRVRLNDEVYEGILKCAEPLHFTQSWSRYESNGQS